METITDKIVVKERKKDKNYPAEIAQAVKILQELTIAAEKQANAGLGNAWPNVERKREELKKLKMLQQAEELADKFKAIEKPDPKFFPRFTDDSGMGRSTYFCNDQIFSSPPKFAMVSLGKNVTRIRIRVVPILKPRWEDYEALIPVMPASVADRAVIAKEMAPDIQFHLLFMPAWNLAPQLDPVLIGTFPGTGEYFLIGEWDGDADLIKEFLTNT